MSAAALLRVHEASLSDGERSRRFLKKSREVIARAGRMSVSAQAETLRIVSGLRTELTGILGAGGLTEFGEFNVRGSIDAVGEAAAAFAERYGRTLDEFRDQGWEFGRKVYDEAFDAAGIVVRLKSISLSQLEVMRASGADLVKGVSDAVRGAMTRELTLVHTGAIDPFTASRRIRDLLATTPRATDGKFGGIAERARSIVRTEVKTAQEMAGEVRRQEWIAAGVEGLKKEWAGCVSRIGHLALNGKIVKADERFPLMGQNGVMYRPRFPRDRDALPVGEIVNCGGYTIPAKDTWDEFLADTGGEG